MITLTLLILAAVNIPFMFNGNQFSWLNCIAFGWCCGLALASFMFME